MIVATGLMLLLVGAASDVPAAPMAGAAAATAHGTPASHYAEIENAVTSGRLMQAGMMLDRLPPEATPSAPLLRARALLQLAENEPRAALELAFRVIAIHPDDAVAHECAGAAALRLRDPRAAGLLGRAVALSPTRWKSWNMLGVLADRAAQWSVADDAYARARAVRPDEPEILNNIGYSLVLRGKSADALPWLARAARLDPASSAIANNLVVASALNGAVPTLPASLPPVRAAAMLNNAGYAFWLNGDVRHGRQLLQQAVTASPTYYARAKNNLDQLERDAR